MNKYPTYKPSNIDWIGEIPSHWEISSFKYYIKLRHGYQFRDNDFTDFGIKIVKITQLDKEGYLNLENCSTIDVNRLENFKDILIYENDILMCLTGGTIGKIIKVGKVSEPLLQNYRVGHFSSINSDVTLNSFIFYLMSSQVILGQILYDIKETGQPNIGLEDMNRMKVCIPTFQEQQAIVSYLDEKTALIDELILKKERKIELLKEQRAALINQAVTKGLDETIPMKDSGIEWIGEVPEHWEVLQIKYLSELLRGKFSHRPRNDERLYGGSYPFIQTGDIVASGKYLMNYTQTLNELGYAVSKEFPINTLVMAIAGNIGDVAILAIKSCFPDSIIGFYPYRNSIVGFLYYLFNSLKDELLKNSTVSTQMNLNVERVGSIKVPLPPLSEQQAIVAYLDEQTALIDKNIELESQKIEKLKEYRQSLISNVVTGKVKVIE